MRVIATERLVYKGKPCRQGHDGTRYASSRDCVQCLAVKSAKRYARETEWNVKRPIGLDSEQKRQWEHANKANVAIRWMLREQLRRVKLAKTSKTSELLGYNAQEFSAHLSSLFQPGMSWLNHGEWHVDHIKSVNKFIQEGITDPKIVNALSNLQPLWKLDNLSKGDKCLIVRNKILQGA